MASYGNRYIDIDLGDIAEGCYVQIHNPRVLPPSMLEPSKRIRIKPDGTPEDEEAAAAAGYEVLARLVRDWHVYDATVLDDDQPVLELPATVDKIKRLPLDVVLRINAEVEKASPNPR